MVRLFLATFCGECGAGITSVVPRCGKCWSAYERTLTHEIRYRQAIGRREKLGPEDTTPPSIIVPGELPRRRAHSPDCCPICHHAAHVGQCPHCRDCDTPEGKAAA